MNFEDYKFFGLLLLTAHLLFLLVSCNISSEKRTVELAQTSLAIIFPNDVTNVQYAEIRENSTYIKPYTIYVRAQMSQESYFDIVKQLQLIQRKENNSHEYAVLLLRPFRPDRQTPSWWLPPPDAIDISASGRFGQATNWGYVVSTYHDGNAYFKAYEEGGS